MKKINFKLFLSIFVIYSQLLSGAYASNSEALNKNIELFDLVSNVLDKKLNQSSSLNYKKAFNIWKEKEGVLRDSITDNTDDLVILLNRELHQLSLSHLGFKKVSFVNLGIQTQINDQGEEEIISIEPNSPVFGSKIKVGTVIIRINGKPVQEGLNILYPEDTNIEFEILDRDHSWLSDPKMMSFIKDNHIKMNKFIKIKVRSASNYKIKGMIGISFDDQANGQIIINKIFKNSPAEDAGLSIGDTILLINNQLPSVVFEKGLKPEVIISVEIRKKDGEEKIIQLTPVSHIQFSKPSFKEISIQNGKSVYLKIPNFYDCYDPNIVHEAMKLAQHHESLIVDLRENSGGRSDHFLAYLLAPGTIIDKIKNSYLLNETKIPTSFDYFDWSAKSLHSPFPYYGKVAFIVDNTTFCAAELCVLAPMEYQELRKHKFMNKVNYKEELYSKNIISFGHTTGAFQGASSQIITTSLGSFFLYFPQSEYVTAIYNNPIEQIGLKGFSYSSSFYPHVESDPIEQAIYWINELNKQTLHIPCQYTENKTYSEIIYDAVKDSLEKYCPFFSENEKIELLKKYSHMIEVFSNPESQRTYLSSSDYQDIYNFLNSIVLKKYRAKEKNNTHSLAHPDADPEFLLELDLGYAVSQLLKNARLAKEYSRSSY